MNLSSQLNVECQSCGRCCRAEIPVTLLDINRIARHLGICDQEVFSTYLQNDVSSGTGIFKMKKRRSGACLFLTPDSLCGIHEAKPRICDLYLCDESRSAQHPVPPVSQIYDEPNWWKLWEKSVAVEITRAYITQNGTRFFAADVDRALDQIQKNTVQHPGQKVKLGRLENGEPIGIIYDCMGCACKGEAAGDTPLTLDDIRRISEFLNIDRDCFFEMFVAETPAAAAGTLALSRKGRCVFFAPEHQCRIDAVRPMHCRFTPCPKLAGDDARFSAFYLASGTVEEQLRHQISLQITREYVAETYTRYNGDLMDEKLEDLERELSDSLAKKAIYDAISPHRYMDDAEGLALGEQRD